VRLSKHQSIDKSIVLLFPLISWGRRGRDRMVVGLQLPLQSVHITTKVMTSNAVHDEVYSNMLIMELLLVISCVQGTRHLPTIEYLFFIRFVQRAEAPFGEAILQKGRN
jgi:hypothetical protein